MTSRGLAMRQRPAASCLDHVSGLPVRRGQAIERELLRAQLTLFDMGLLLEAVNGMYADETPPGESEVCRRVREAYQHRGLQVPPYLERRIIMAYSLFRGVYSVRRGDKNGQAVVYLLEPPQGFEGFVDPRADYEYPAVVWQQLIGFFTALMTTPYAAITRHPVADLHLYEYKGGRYGTGYEIMALFAANSTRGKGSGKGTSNGKCEPPSGVGAGEAWVLLQRLVRQHMPCLGDMGVLYGRPMTLGHVCRLTQQAIKKGILTYEDNILKPTAAAHGPTRAAFPLMAAAGADDCGGGNGGVSCQAECVPTPKLLHAASVLEEMLAEHPKGILLCQLREKLRKEHNFVLDHQAFGYAQMSKLLAVAPFKCFCRLFYGDGLLYGTHDKANAVHQPPPLSRSRSSTPPPFSVPHSLSPVCGGTDADDTEAASSTTTTSSPSSEGFGAGEGLVDGSSSRSRLVVQHRQYSVPPHAVPYTYNTRQQPQQQQEQQQQVVDEPSCVRGAVSGEGDINLLPLAVFAPPVSSSMLSFYHAKLTTEGPVSLPCTISWAGAGAGSDHSKEWFVDMPAPPQLDLTFV